MIGYALLFALASTQAEPPSQPEMDTKPEPWSDSERELRNAGAFAKSNDPDSRTELEALAGCIAAKNPAEAKRVLTMDFTTGAYDRALRMLALGDKRCVEFRGALRTANLLFAGELAESMLESDSTPLANRLAKAGTAPATTSYSFTDKVAICVVRSVPDDVAALFATARNSPEETARINALAVPMGMCAKAAEARKPLAVNPAGLRAMLATASYRQLATGEG